MDVIEAVKTRKSVRAFLPKPVPNAILQEILELATRAPSGSNLQPWRVAVLVGKARDEFVRRALLAFDSNPAGEPAEYLIHPPEMSEVYKQRYISAGMKMYSAALIDRNDTEARTRQRRRNCEFFGAPVGLMFTIDRPMQPGQWADVGMFMQTIMLLARGYGLDSCAQEAWAIRPSLIRDFLNLPDDQVVYCGMAIGYADPQAPINNFASDRAPIGEVVRFVDIE